MRSKLWDAFILGFCAHKPIHYFVHQCLQSSWCFHLNLWSYPIPQSLLLYRFLFQETPSAPILALAGCHLRLCLSLKFYLMLMLPLLTWYPGNASICLVLIASDMSVLKQFFLFFSGCYCIVKTLTSGSHSQHCIVKVKFFFFCKNWTRDFFLVGVILLWKFYGWLSPSILNPRPDFSNGCHFYCKSLIISSSIP